MIRRVTGAVILSLAGVCLLAVAAYAVIEFRAYSPVYRPLVVQFTNRSLGGGMMEMTNGSVRLGASVAANCENPNPYGFFIEADQSGSVMLSDAEGNRRIGNITVPSTAIHPGSSALVELNLAAEVSVLEGMSLMTQPSVAIFFTIRVEVGALPEFLFFSRRVSMTEEFVCGLSMDFSHDGPHPGPIHCSKSFAEVDLNATNAEPPRSRFAVDLPEQMLSNATMLKNSCFTILIILSAASRNGLVYLTFRLLRAPAAGKKARELKRSSSGHSGGSIDEDEESNEPQESNESNEPHNSNESNEPQESNESGEPQGSEPQTNEGVDSAV